MNLHTSHHRMRRVALSLCLLTAGTASAQTTAAIDQAIHSSWSETIIRVAKQHDVTLEGHTFPPSTPSQVRQQIYRDTLIALRDDPSLRKLAVPDASVVDQTTPENERKYIRELTAANAAHTQPKSVSSNSTNPAAGTTSEHSGFTELLALALNAQNFFNSNATAVSLNLNALALFSLADPEVYSELHRYQEHSLLRRIGGTVVFGAKVPEKEITGVSGLPDADKLLDTFSWDVKLRLVGDKDPRARQWYDETLGRFGVINQLIVLQADVPVDDLPLLNQELNSLIGDWLTSLKRRINRSPQLTFKTAGTHLTEDAGDNKYSAGLLYDQGFGTDTDFTANALFSATTDSHLGKDQLYTVKQFQANASLMAKLAPGAIVTGRTVDWSNGVAATLFTNKGSLPVPVNNTWKLFTKLEIPLTDSATIPISVVYTNDKNELKKTQYVAGFVGIAYDFSAVPKLFQGAKAAGAATTH